ncbi:MAG: hypothetical protein WD426_12570 [Anditalea sp.]
MKDHLLYYSTNTKVAFFIAEQFYQSTHFVWCAPVYNPEKLDEYDFRRKIPASSSPFKIYKNLLDDIKSNDKHSSKIEQNRIGLKKGAAIMREKGIIDDNDFARILKIIDLADINEFAPLVYLIPASLVSTKVNSVDVNDAASPLSSECQIYDLQRTEFDIIEFE